MTVTSYGNLHLFFSSGKLGNEGINFIVYVSLSKYFPNHKLPENIIATTSAKDALLGADFCLHAVPVQVILYHMPSLIVLNNMLVIF